MQEVKNMPTFVPKGKKIEEIEAYTVRTSVDKLQQIDKIADKLRVSRNDIVNQCIDFALKNMTEDFWKDDSK